MNMNMSEVHVIRFSALEAVDNEYTSVWDDRSPLSLVTSKLKMRRVRCPIWAMSGAPMSMTLMAWDAGICACKYAMNICTGEALRAYWKFMNFQ